MQIILANPRGFCAGVDRAIRIVEQALKLFGAPIYVRHELVHNKYVIKDLQTKGVFFVEETDHIPDNSIVIFSAHGVSKAVWERVALRRLRVFDATCPLVTKVHMEVEHHCRAGRECILIGHANHPEVEGTMGQWDNLEGNACMYLVQNIEEAGVLEVKNPDHLAYVTQTTLSVDDTRGIINILRKRFPKITGPLTDDICFATQNRQNAIKKLAVCCDIILIIGSSISSNSNRLRETAEQLGVSAYLVDEPKKIQRDWIQGMLSIGITAGASTPEILVSQTIDLLRNWGATAIIEMKGDSESVSFSLPKQLRADNPVHYDD